MLVFLPQITVFIYFISFNQVWMFAENYYCGSTFCSNSTEHVMCKFQFEGPARHCINYERTIKSESDKRLVLDKINSRRNKVAAGEIRSLRSAENMVKLEWNEELALFAQRWADQCVERSVPDTEDTCRDLEHSSVGQNIASVYGDAPGLTPSTLVDLWYMELLNVNSTIISQYQRSMVAGTDHYDYFTQLMWAETSEVGCGAVKFKEQIKELELVKNRTVYRLVCNFAPAGNQVGKAVYADGLACSRCPFNGACDSVFNALCAQITTNDVKTEVVDRPLELRQFIRTKYSTVTEPNIVNRPVENLTNMGVGIMPENKTDYDENIPYNFLSDFLKLTTKSSTLNVENITICKDVLVVDELYNLLKRKISEDQSFRELLLTNKSTQNGNTDEPLDPGVEKFMGHIYSKKISRTTPKMTDNEYLNSTLLVDLVEAVIFRNNERMPIPATTEASTQSAMDVNPLKIQAELGEIKLNSDFTGHYFFPEDNSDQSSSDKLDDYYDTSDSSISDIALEIEDLRRNKGTKDFIEAILDSDFVTEALVDTLRTPIVRNSDTEQQSSLNITEFLV